MTFRISQFAALCGLSLLALPGSVQAQAPRYQSPLSVPATPQPQVLPTPEAITPKRVLIISLSIPSRPLAASRSCSERDRSLLRAFWALRASTSLPISAAISPVKLAAPGGNSTTR